MTLPAQAMALRNAIPWNLIQNGLYDWVHGNTGLPTIFGRQPGNVLQPQRAFATIDLTGGPISLGRDGLGMQNNIGATPGPAVGKEVSSVLFGLRGLSVSVNVFSDSRKFADNAMSYVAALQASLSLEATIAQLYSSGLASRSFGEIINLSELQESIWVSRANLDINFTTAMYTTAGDAEGYIGEVIGTATVVEGNPNATSISTTVDVKGL